MNDPLDMSAQSPLLDAVALVSAQQRHDGDSVDSILATADLEDDR